MQKRTSVFLVGCVLVGLGLSLPVFAAPSVETNRAERIWAELRDASVNKVFVVAHRAAWKDSKAPENSLQAMRDAIEMGVDIIEIDIRKTRDGKFVVMHDDRINRTSNGTGPVSSMTLEQLKTFRLKSRNGTVTDEQIPTVDEVLDVCKDQVLINFDKAHNYIAELLPILAEKGVSKQVIMKGKLPASEVESLFAESRDTLYIPLVGPKNFDTNVVIGAESPAVRELFPCIGEGAEVVEFIFSNIGHPSTASAVLDTFKAVDVRLWVNTLRVCHAAGYVDSAAVRNPDKVWGDLINRGFSVIQTDEPAKLLAYIREKGLHD